MVERSDGPLRATARHADPSEGSHQRSSLARGLLHVAPARRRVFCMPITNPADRRGEPSLWSAAVDALAAGTDVGRSDSGIELLGPPDPDAARLLIVSTGNIRDGFDLDYRRLADLSPIEDPAQSWNALTVAAHTELTQVPSDPTYAGWRAVAEEGDVSPHSRTGVIAGGPKSPINPDIRMEGGNVPTDGAGDFHANHPLLSLRTTDRRDDAALGSANATSAATAQAARLAASPRSPWPPIRPTGPRRSGASSPTTPNGPRSCEPRSTPNPARSSGGRFSSATAGVSRTSRAC